MQLITVTLKEVTPLEDCILRTQNYTASKNSFQKVDKYEKVKKDEKETLKRNIYGSEGIAKCVPL